MYYKVVCTIGAKPVKCENQQKCLEQDKYEFLCRQRSTV